MSLEEVVFRYPQQSELGIRDGRLRHAGLYHDDLQGDTRRITHLPKRLDERDIARSMRDGAPLAFRLSSRRSRCVKGSVRFSDVRIQRMLVCA